MSTRQQGTADFHADGRHTHITELLRNGATLPEAKELARHSDVRMTMRYTHIPLEDQAKALEWLPVCQEADESCQDIVRKSGVPSSHQQSNGDTGEQRDSLASDRANPFAERNLSTGDREKSAEAEKVEKRRTRDSNPQPLRAPEFQSGR